MALQRIRDGIIFACYVTNKKNMKPPQEVTQLLRSWSAGDKAALNELMPLVYEELHRRAHAYMRSERADHSMQTTELVHEVYAKLVDSNSVNFNDRAHFLAVCATTMRRILVDHARARHQIKRGGEYQKVSLEDALLISAGSDQMDYAALDDAMQLLAEAAPRKAQVVEMKFFGGLTAKETSVVLGVSEDTVLDDWKFAKRFLFRELSKNDPSTMGTS